MVLLSLVLLYLIEEIGSLVGSIESFFLEKIILSSSRELYKYRDEIYFY
jgi:hypothetical protein